MTEAEHIVHAYEREFGDGAKLALAKAYLYALDRTSHGHARGRLRVSPYVGRPLDITAPDHALDIDSTESPNG